jgi:hypothetical protein
LIAIAPFPSEHWRAEESSQTRVGDKTSAASWERIRTSEKGHQPNKPDKTDDQCGVIISQRFRVVQQVETAVTGGNAWRIDIRPVVTTTWHPAAVSVSHII